MSDQGTPQIEQSPDELEAEVTSEETEPESADGEEVDPSEEPEAKTEGEQASAAATAPVAAQPGALANAQKVMWKEDPTDFDESTIEIAITLHPLKGRQPEERLVTFCVHNYSGDPVTNFYTQGDLTNESPLDRLLWAIAQEIKKFRADLSRRKQVQFEREEQAKKTRRGHSSPAPARAATVAAAPVAQQQAVTVDKAPGGEATTTQRAPAATVGKAAPAPTTSTKKEDGLVQQPLF